MAYTIRPGCRVGFFGLGVSNIALMSRLDLRGCKIRIRSDGKIDPRDIPQGIPSPEIYEMGRGVIDDDILFLSPSVRRDRADIADAVRRGVRLCSDAELFFSAPPKEVIAVSGSDGKSTTATLTYLLLREAGVDCCLLGNIGAPFITRRADVAVCELSSFMLSYLEAKSKRAAITSITPNHLDWHKSFEEYKKTKIDLLRHTEQAVIPYGLPYTGNIYAIVSDSLPLEELKGRREAEVYFTVESGYIKRNGRPIIPLSQVKRNEPHHIMDLALAIALTDGTVGEDEIVRVASSFRGLPHRCERIGRFFGIECIDSSIDSTPDRTATTLYSLNRPAVVILGGRGKGTDYSALIAPLTKYARVAVLIGENREEIRSAIGGRIKCLFADDLQDGVITALGNIRPDETLLLSPASASYDMFKNYSERGDRFKEILTKLAKNENISLQNIEEMREKSEKDLS